MRRVAELDLRARHKGFAYQLQAVEAVKHLSYAALFHEQGLGKTKIGIDLALQWLREDTVDAVLFVTKRGLVQNWIEEILAHSHLRARVLDQNHTSNFYSLNSNIPVFLAHYEVLRSEERRLALFLRTRRVAVILDEAHKIKNPESELARSLHRLGPKFVRRVIMTGTPVANRPYDLWSQIYFLDQGASLGSDFIGFKNNLELGNDLWANTERKRRFEDELAKVFDRIRPFSVRETKSSAGIELPEKSIENVYVELSPRQRSLYDEIRTELSAAVTVDGELIQDDSESILKRLLRLVQVSSNPMLVDEAYEEEPAKYASLERLLSSATEGGSKVIVWTNFVENADWLAGRLDHYGAVKVHGGISPEERTSAIAEFKNDPSCRILVATPGSAKEGLTLTVANHAIFFDRSFSLDDYLQAQDRIHRISQTQPCFIWNLIGKSTVDEWVDSLLAAKRLAAQLAQADIGREEYDRLADYDFGRAVREILGGHD
ncbi:helicase [Methylorubrum extorquens]|uniref:Helicase n=1 Tax=Methylorubrum extorquens TaxID=408 RepID=A0A1S1P1Z5_METEX|nr:helicase [Methylorubrum extorquens]